MTSWIRLNVDRGHRDGGQLHFRRIGQRTESVSSVLWDLRIGGLVEARREPLLKPRNISDGYKQLPERGNRETNEGDSQR